MMAVLRKELRTLLRERRGFLVPVLYALTLSLLVSLYLISVQGSSQQSRNLGSFIAGLVAVLQTIAVVIFSPLVGASMIAGERERGTWARLLSSPASRDGIVLGKLAACGLYLFLLISISFPVAALSLLFGGIDFGSLAALYLIHAGAAVCLASIGLAVSTGFARTWAASFVALGLSLALIVGLPAIGATATTLARGALSEPGVVLRVTNWLNPGYGLFLFFTNETGKRQDWLAHYAAMLALAGGAFLVAHSRVRGAGE